MIQRVRANARAAHPCDQAYALATSISRTLVPVLSAALHQRQSLPTGRSAMLMASPRNCSKAPFRSSSSLLAISRSRILHAVLAMVPPYIVTTRAATLSLRRLGTGDGVNLCSVWTAVWVRTSFASGLPDMILGAIGARGLIESGEADALLWVDALPARESSGRAACRR